MGLPAFGQLSFEDIDKEYSKSNWASSNIQMDDLYSRYNLTPPVGDMDMSPFYNKFVVRSRFIPGTDKIVGHTRTALFRLYLNGQTTGLSDIYTEYNMNVNFDDEGPYDCSLKLEYSRTISESNWILLREITGSHPWHDNLRISDVTVEESTHIIFRCTAYHSGGEFGYSIDVTRNIITYSSPDAINIQDEPDFLSFTDTPV